MQKQAEQLLIDFPDNWQEYNRDDLVVTESNLMAYKLISNWPDWGAPFAAIIGAPGSGKSHFAHVWAQTSHAYCADMSNLDVASEVVSQGQSILLEDLSAGNFNENALFHLLNNISQSRVNYPNISLLITARSDFTLWDLKLADLLSRLRTIIKVIIGQTDEMLLRSVLIKLFSDKQIIVENSVISYIITRMERSLTFAAQLVNLCDKYAIINGSKINKRIVNKALAVLFDR